MPYTTAKKSILAISLVSVLFVWLGESLLHYLILDPGEPFQLIPPNLNELWMRTIICCLILAFGFYVQRQMNKRIALEEAKMRTLKATMHTVEDRVGNTLSGMKMIIEQKTRNRELDESLHDLLVGGIDQAFVDLREISAISKITERKYSKDIFYLDLKSGSEAH